MAQRQTQLAALRWDTAGGCQRFEDLPPNKEEKGEEACVVGGTAGGSPRTLSGKYQYVGAVKTVSTLLAVYLCVSYTVKELISDAFQLCNIQLFLHG